MKKLIKHAKKGVIGLSHGKGGIIAISIRETAKDKFLAKQANKGK